MKNILKFLFTILLFLIIKPEHGNAQSIQGFTPSTIASGRESNITINGSGFGTGGPSASKFVEFKSGDTGGTTYIKPAVVEYVSWNDTQIILKVPSKAGSGVIRVNNGGSVMTSTTSLFVTYSIINADETPKPVRMANTNSSGGYTFQMETSFNASSANASFMRAFQTLTCGTGVNWKIGATTAINKSADDDVNVITFDKTDELDAGNLGVAFSYYDVCNGDLILEEVDVVFASTSKRNWYYGTGTTPSSEFDLESVALHELGHAHGFGHVIDPSDVMNYQIGSGTSRRFLNSRNLEAGAFQMNKSTTATCSPMSALPAGSCTLPPPTITSFNATSGREGAGITITGTNFSAVKAVSFGGTPAASFSISSPTTVVGILATGASGSVSITTPGGTASLQGFTFLPPPTIASFTPTTATPGTTITITGTNFTGVTAVVLGNNSAASFTVVSPTTITAVLGSSQSGNVQVSTTGGTATLGGFTALQPPVVNQFAPRTVGTGGTVTISGTNFTGATAVSFGGTPAASFVVNSASSITAKVAVGSSGAVSVTTPNGTSTSPGFIFIPAPTISSFTPKTGDYITSVTITGTNFTGTTSISFGGVTTDSFDILSSTSLRVKPPPSAASGDVSVTTPGGTATLGGFTFIPTLTVLNFSPVSGGTGTVVTIIGSNYANVTNVRFGTRNAASFKINSPTSITAIVGAGETGDVSVITPGATASWSFFRYIPSPTITSFTPLNAGTGATITLTGTDFTGATAVSFGGTAATLFTVISPTTITAVVGAGTTGDVSVTTPGGIATKTGFNFFLPPAISSFAPLTAGAGTTVTITGTNFTGTTAVSFGGTPAASFAVVSPTSITAVVAAGSSGNVSVTNPARTTSITGFTFIPAPLISSFTPVSAVPGATVTITGTNFTGATAVSFGGTPAASFTIISPTSISAVVGTGSSGSVSVVTTGGTASRAGFTFVPVLSVTSFAPLTAAAGATVTITGTLYTGVTAVSFGGTPAASFAVVSPTSITAVLAAGSSGSVSVTTAGGTASAPGFTFIPAPVISAFNPASAAQGATVTITGTNFTGATSVSFGGTAAASFTVVSPTSITAVIATGSTGTISVTTPGGTASTTGFNYLPPPVISSFAPLTAASGATVTITGTNLTGVTAVSFGGTAAASFAVVSATSITAVVAAGSSGSVSVTTAGGTASVTGFTFIPAPVISAFNPAIAAQGATVTITGANFTGASSVSFGGTAAASFILVSPTSITAVIATGSTGEISVTTPGGKRSISGFTFIPRPAITSFTPTTAISQVLVSISGTNFNNATAVSFGNKAASSFTVVSPSLITAIVANGSSSGNVSVTTPGGTGVLGGFTFVYSLPATNFKILSIDETCRTSNNGSITVEASQPLNYTATVTGNNNTITRTFTGSIEFKDLSSGTYSVCITVGGQADYKKCFDIIINEPKDLALYAKINPGNILELNLSGSTSYKVELNGKVFTTTRDQLNLPLLKGNNLVRISSDLDCQGVIEKQIVVSENILLYPNPFENQLSIDVGTNKSKSARVKISTVYGNVVHSGTYSIDYGKVHLDLSNLTSGHYVLLLSLDGLESVYKIIKK